MVLLRSIWSIAATLYNNSSFWSWPIASISTTWVSLKSDTLAWVFNHAVWGLGAGSRGKKRWRDRRKEGAESGKDCSDRGNRSLNSDEIIQFVSWENRQRSAAETEQKPPGDLARFHNPSSLTFLLQSKHLQAIAIHPPINNLPCGVTGHLQSQLKTAKNC